MILAFFKKRKNEKLERELCKRYAELTAVREIFYRPGVGEMPGLIVSQMVELPGKIAFLEKQIEQLKG